MVVCLRGVWFIWSMGWGGEFDNRIAVQEDEWMVDFVWGKGLGGG